jgi:hypothetical protein
MFMVIVITMNVQTKLERLICPECHQKGFTSPQMLGRHRKSSHGIKGRYAENSRRTYLAKKALKESSLAVTIPNAIPAEEKVDAPIQRRQSHTDAEAALAQLVAYTVGKLETVAEGIANQNDIPARQFARRCAEYFSAAASR